MDQEATGVIERKKIKFDSSVYKEFSQRNTGNIFSLRSVDPTRKILPKDLKRMAQICNEKEIYKRLFSYRLDDNPYTESDAKEFLLQARNDWKGKRQFIFLIYDDKNRISGLIDINTSENISRIGYWNSYENPGVMSKALDALSSVAKEAGFDELFATPNPDNIASQKALKNAGYKKGESVEAWNGEMWPKYSINLK